MIDQSLKVDLIPGGGPKVVRVSQYDNESRNIIVNIFNDKSAYTIPTGTTVQVRGTKPSGKGFLYTCSFTGNVVTVVVKDQMTAESGKVRCEIVLINGNAILGSANFELLVERSSFDPGTVTSSDTFESLVEDAVIKCANEKLIGSGSVSDEQIAEAVATYLENNPVEAGATEAQAKQIQENTTKISQLSDDIANKEESGAAESKITAHDIANDAHNDIRLLIQNLDR